MNASTVAPPSSRMAAIFYTRASPRFRRTTGYTSARWTPSQNSRDSRKFSRRRSECNLWPHRVVTESCYFCERARRARCGLRSSISSRLALMGEPAPVLPHVGHNPAFGFFDASANALVYRNAPGEEIAQMAWFDRHGKRAASFGESASLYSQPVLSPDGSRVAMAKFDGGNIDVWVYDLFRNVNQRLTSDPALDDSPVWSHDGKRLAFASSRAGHYDLYQIAASGEGREELLFASGENKFPTSWSPDGRYLLYGAQARETTGDIWVLPLDGTSKRAPVPLVHTRANEGGGTFSPDARWIAYVSDDSGIAEVYVQPFILPSASVDSPAGPKVLVSRKGGRRPRWRADGKELFYNSPDGALMSVAVTAGATFRPGIPQLLFRTPAAWFSEANATSDGTRFLVAVPVEQTTSATLHGSAQLAGGVGCKK